MTITQADIGRKVVYEDGYGFNDEGVVTNLNSNYVFVRYGSQCHSQATRYSDLSLI